MAVGEAPASLAGNVGLDPELRYLPNTETAVCDLRVASHERVWSKEEGGWVDGPVMWTSVRTFGSLAEHVAKTIRRGQRVIVAGKWSYREWEKNGQIRSAHFIEASDVGRSVLFASGADSEAPA